MPTLLQALLVSILCVVHGTDAAAAPDAPAARAPTVAARPQASFTILPTGQVTVREAMLFAGGRFGEKAHSVFAAFLIRHGDQTLMLDTGLGGRIAEQFAQDMPWWARGAFGYEQPVRPAAAQLRAAGVPLPQRIVLSHAHWDHASALEEFPGAEVYAAAEELAQIRQARAGVATAWPSQVSDKPLSWHALVFDGPAHEGFETSRDWFGDGSVVFVPMRGHTPGSVGLFLTTGSGRRFFFVGDVLWHSGALAEGRPKIWAARLLVDADVDGTQRAIERIRAAAARDPALVIVPAHDGAVFDRLGRFPAWID
ncbi:MBL fold metallo-hydrolase [Aquabacterium humicola]|uniref:MBL fold metallo-hydrolase n=1 Tax=Aquabacterium humicola TaxID=3237377 RepID=UPI002542893D|nr:MBL fold metallo-hydrolase [Rubrivivax pictus]